MKERKTIEVTFTGEKSRCQKCLSLKRSRYHRVIAKDIHGKLDDGTLFHGVIWRRTECKSCGQARTDKVYVVDAPVIEEPPVPQQDTLNL